VTRKSYAKALDEVLRPLGFERSGDDWLRIRGDMWECVHRHSSWLGGVTAEFFMKDLETEKIYMEIFRPEGAIQMPAISASIGQLIDGYSRKWGEEPDGPANMANAVERHGLPWFDRVRSLEEQATNWYGRDTALSSRGYDGHSLVGLALTLYRMGELDEACAALRKPVPKTAIPASVKRVATLRKWLGCDDADRSTRS
jgi:hypothetical protein